MNKIDPRLFAAGIGAVTGTSFMATDDNDLVALGAGALIGGGTGMMMDLSKPSDLDLKANRAAKNTVKSIHEDSIGVGKRTFEESKESLKKLALHIANKNSGTESYNREMPFSSLNKKSFSSFLVDLDNIHSPEMLKNLELSLKNKTDSLNIKESDIAKGMAVDVAPLNVVREGATLADKTLALKEELINLGYKDNSAELNIKLKRLSPLLEIQEGVLKIGDGKIDFGGDMGSLKLTYQSVSETGEVALQAASNRNIYDVGRINLMGSAILNETLDSPKAVADAVGITMANLFNMNKQVGDVVEGLAPDDAAGLFAHVTKDPKQVGSFIGKIGDKATHNEQASGAYRESLMRGINEKPMASAHSVSISNTVDYAHSFNINDNGTFNKEKPLRKLGIVSANGRQQSEIKSLVAEMSKRTGVPFAGTSADHATQLPRTEMTTFDQATGKYSINPSSASNKVLSVAGAWERNLGTINNRAIVHEAPDLPYKKHVDEIIGEFGAKFQYASGMAVQTIAINPKAQLSIEAGHSKLFADFLADSFGSDMIVGDGYGMANRDVTDKIHTSGNVGVSFGKTVGNEYTMSDPNFQRLAKGEITFDQLREQAEKGVSRITGKAETSLKDAQRSLVKIQDAVKNAGGDSSKLLQALKQDLPGFRGFGTVKDAIGKAPKKKQVEELQKKAVKMVNQTIKSNALYTERSSHMADSANTARSAVRDNVTAIRGNKDLTSSLQMVSDVLAHNTEAKKFGSEASSFYPKAKQVMGYNPDGTAIALKQNYASYEFLGMFEGVNQTGDNSATRSLEAMFKGKVSIGSQETFKSFAIGTKAQLKNVGSDYIAKTAFLSKYVEEGNFSVDSKTNRGTLNVTLEDGSVKPVSFSPGELNRLSVKEIFDKNKVPFTIRLEEEFDRMKNIAAITEDDSSGLKIQKKLLDIMINDPAKIEETSNSKILGKFLTDRVSQANGDKNIIKSLVDFSIATSNDKASTDFLLTSVTSVKESASHKLSIYTNAPDGLPKQKALSDLQDYARGMLQTSTFDGKTIIDPTEFNTAVNSRISGVMQYYTSDGFKSNFYSLTQSNDKMNNVADFFVQERKYRPSGLGDTLLRMISANRIAEQESGSGKNYKNMSWNMIEQLKMNGFNDSDMNLFGKVNSETAADYSSIKMLTRHVKDSVNSQLNDANEGAFKQALVSAPEKRREALQRAGINIEGRVGAYTIASENASGIKNIPILMEDSLLFGSYSNKEGEMTQKKIHRVIQEAVSADMRVQKATTKLDREAAQEVLENKLKYISETVTPMLTGSGNIAKRVMSREASQSLFSLSAPVAGSLRAFAEQIGDNHVVSVSSAGLLKRLKEVGMNYDSIEDARKAGIIKSTGHKGLSEVFLDNTQKTPFFGFLSREPAVGMGSATTVKYMLDENIKASGKMLFTAVDNPITSLFKFLDHDFDHVLEVFPKIKGTSTEQLSDLYHVKGKAINNQLDEMIDFAKVLGVKGKDRDKLKSFFDLVDQEGVVDNKSFMDKFLEDTAVSRMKGQDRKTISPAVTKLAADLNHAILGNGGDEKTVGRARIMGHYFVENLLKSMHTGTAEYKKRAVTLAEELSADIMSGNKDRFNTTFGQFMEDSIIDGRIAKEVSGAKRDELEKQVREAYKYIQSSVNNHSFSEATTPMHLSRGGNLDKLVNNMVDVVEGAHTAIPISHVSEELVNEGNEQSLVQRGKVGYHKASEIIKHNILNNKKLLGGAAAATIAAALITQKKPDFGNQNAHANTSGMLLRSSKSSLEDTATQTGFMGGVHKATEYMHLNGSQGQKSVQVDGFQTGYNSSGNLGNDVNNFMFGDGMSTVRILNS